MMSRLKMKSIWLILGMLFLAVAWYEKRIGFWALLGLCACISIYSLIQVVRRFRRCMRSDDAWFRPTLGRVAELIATALFTAVAAILAILGSRMTAGIPVFLFVFLAGLTDSVNLSLNGIVCIAGES